MNFLLLKLLAMMTEQQIVEVVPSHAQSHFVGGSVQLLALIIGVQEVSQMQLLRYRKAGVRLIVLMDQSGLFQR